MRFKPVSIKTPTLSLIAFLVLTTAMSAAAAAGELLSRSPERGGIGLDLQQRRFDTQFAKSGKPSRGGLLNKLDERLSLIVTDRASTSAITFSEVMDKLAADMHVDRLTLFRRWWDTALKIPSEISDRATNVFCNSGTEAVYNDLSEIDLSEINGFPYQCPRAEGNESGRDPFNNEACPPCRNPTGYSAIAFVNRFDLADKDRGRHCGEFRIVFARNSGFTQNIRRNLIIFEALVPNPSPPHPRKDATSDPFANLEGCRPIVEFWLNLSNTDMTTAARGKALHDFFLKGLPKDSIAKGLPERAIGPIVDTHHYAGGPRSGQIRTNQFMDGSWTLREFKTYGGSIVPATVKSNPGNDLFSSFAPGDPRKQELEDYLVTKDALANLRGIGSQESAEAENDIFTFAFGLTTAGLDHLNSFDSQEGKPDLGDVVEAFKHCNAPCPLEKRINGALKDAGSKLDAKTIVHRIRTQTCAGCHHYSNEDRELKVSCPEGWPDKLCFTEGPDRLGIWPSTLGASVSGIGGFTHVSEETPRESGLDKDVFDLASLKAITPENLRAIRSKRISHLSYKGPDGDRYRISDTLKLVLMPPRFENMVLYLNRFTPPN